MSVEPSRQQRRTQRTRASLVGAALEVFLDKGYDGASLSEITTRADVGTGTLYLHFRDKRSLYEAMVRHQLLTLRDRWLAERGARHLDSDPAGEIAFMVRLVIESTIANPRYARLILCDGPAIETWLADEAGRAMAQVFAKRIADAELVATMVIGATLAACRFYVTQPDAVSTKKLIENAVAFCVRGIVPTATPSTTRRG